MKVSLENEMCCTYEKIFNYLLIDYYIFELIARVDKVISWTSIVKTRQTNRWHHLPAYSCSARGIAHREGGV